MGKTIPIKISWKFAMQAYIAAIEDGTEEGKKMAKKALFELAIGLDDNLDLFQASEDLYNAAETTLTHIKENESELSEIGFPQGMIQNLLETVIKKADTGEATE